MGKVIMSGIVNYLSKPISGILASDLTVGSTVKLMEDGVATEYLVVNQGKPSGSSLYDDSCDGLWLLRKDIHSNRVWDSTNNDYKNSDIHAWLNSDFFNIFGSVEQATIKQVKIPYVNGTGGSAVASGSSGLLTNVFLLSGYELGFTESTASFIRTDGACLSYFSGESKQEDSRRISYLNGVASNWWTRSINIYDSTFTMYIMLNGDREGAVGCEVSRGIRPALILPSNALFDKNTLILKGVA